MDDRKYIHWLLRLYVLGLAASAVPALLPFGQNLWRNLHSLSAHLPNDIGLYFLAEHINDGVQTHLLLDREALVVLANDHSEQFSIGCLHPLAPEVVVLQFIVC